MQVLISNQELYRIVGRNMKVSIYVYVYMSDLEWHPFLKEWQIALQ